MNVQKTLGLVAFVVGMNLFKDFDIWWVETLAMGLIVGGLIVLTWQAHP